MGSTIRTLAIVFVLPPATLSLFIFVVPQFAHGDVAILVAWTLVLTAGLLAIWTSGWRRTAQVIASGCYAILFAAALPFVTLIGGCISGPCLF